MNYIAFKLHLIWKAQWTRVEKSNILCKCFGKVSDVGDLRLLHFRSCHATHLLQGQRFGWRFFLTFSQRNFVLCMRQKFNINRNKPFIKDKLYKKNQLVLAARLKEDLEYNVWWNFDKILRKFIKCKDSHPILMAIADI